MKRKIILRLSLMIVFLTVFWSCHSEDFTNGKAEPQRNNANFFLHSEKGGAAAKGGVDYVSILETYNREKDFLSTMPDQQGMPIWDKMQVLDNGEKTVLYVPLSADRTGLSSLLIVNIDEENAVSRLQNFTNDYLEAYVYNADNPTAKRKLLMDTFLQMDFFTFGHQEFTNLPKDLYKGSTEYNRLNIPEVKIEAEQNKGFIYNTVCTTFHYCVHGQGTSSCDYGNCTCGGFIKCFVVTSCTTTATWIDDPFPSFPGSHSGGGGGGTPGPQPPVDPCVMNTVFYRVQPGCLGSGGDINNLDNPCEILARNLQKAKTLIDQNEVKTKNDAMKANIITDTFEKAFYWGKDSSGTVKTSNVVDGTGTNVNLSISNSQFTPEAYVHNHAGTQGYTNFSSQDINKFYDFHTGFNTIIHNYANGSDGSLYVMTLENQSDFDTFIAQYPNSSIDANNDWQQGTDIRTDENNILQYFIDQGKTADEAMDLTLGYLISKYNMGIMISKKGLDGNFHPIQVEKVESTDPLSGQTIVSYQKINPCNL
ncbi:hypothetical protein [uncultured Chryseobacterium sp.]|uniref:hypothetical protein n=1 Tax=uncultured Chryseobacterium sp. TaxID=259322 RepID=UPI0025FB081C|nr:hypothetical protein [uncultured Chryseobacterium sp.]